MVQIRTGAPDVGTFTYPIRVYSQDRARSERITPLVDTGSLFTWIPGGVLRELGLAPIQDMPFRMANGQLITRPMADVPIEIDGAVGITAVVFAEPGDMTLLGALALERFLLMPDVVHQRLVPIVAPVA